MANPPDDKNPNSGKPGSAKDAGANNKPTGVRPPPVQKAASPEGQKPAAPAKAPQGQQPRGQQSGSQPTAANVTRTSNSGASDTPPPLPKTAQTAKVSSAKAPAPKAATGSVQHTPGRTQTKAPAKAPAPRVRSKLERPGAQQKTKPAQAQSRLQRSAAPAQKPAGQPGAQPNRTASGATHSTDSATPSRSTTARSATGRTGPDRMTREPVAPSRAAAPGRMEPRRPAPTRDDPRRDAPRRDAPSRASAGGQRHYRDSRPMPPRRRMAPPPGAGKGRYIAAPGHQPGRRGHVVAPDRAAAGGSAWGPLLLGLLLLLGVLWYAVKQYAPSINADLTTRSNTALAEAGYDNGASVAIDGRTAILSGNVASAADSEKAEEVVAGTLGVRSVVNELTVGEVSQSAADSRVAPSLSFASSSDGVQLSGTVSDQQYADQIEASAKELYGADKVSGNLEVDANSTNPGWWPAVSQLVPDLNAIEDGSFSVADGELKLTGTAADAQTKDSIGSKAEELLQGQLTVSNEITAPEAIPEPTLEPGYATFADNGRQITLYGSLPADTAAEIEAAFANADKPVRNNFVISDAIEAPAWTSSFGEAFGAMQNLDKAKLQVLASGNVVISGTADSAEAQQTASATVTELFGDLNVVDKIAVTAPPPPEPVTLEPGYATFADNGRQITLFGSLPAETAAEIEGAFANADKPVRNNFVISDAIAAPAWTSSFGEAFGAMQGIDKAKLQVLTSGNVVISGTAESAEAQQSAAATVTGLFSDLNVVDKIAVKAPEPEPVPAPEPEPAPKPALQPFINVQDNGDQIRIAGLLPPAAAAAITKAYESTGRTVVSGISADDRVSSPAWTFAVGQVLNSMQDLENPSVNVSSTGTLTLRGVAPSESIREQVAANSSAAFGRSVILRNDISVKGPDISELFANIDIAAIRFRSNSSELDAASVGILQQVADALIQVPQATVEIEGHTDSTGNDARNTVLSAERAERVRNFLVNQGISGDRMTSTGYGSTQPIASNGTSTGRALNRRIEFVLTNGE